jgi:predicted RNase H-like nuclease (RuvC/YqgF family)
MATEAINNATMEQQTVEELPKTKGKTTKKQTGAASSSNDDVSTLRTLVESLTKRIDELETRVRELEGKNTDTKETPTKQKPTKSNEEKKPRAPTAYNLFMKEKMTELKETHPTLTNIERMKMAAEAWTESKK